MTGPLIVLVIAVVYVFVTHRAWSRCEANIDGWRTGYDEGYADAEAGRPPNPTKPSCSG